MGDLMDQILGPSTPKTDEQKAFDAAVDYEAKYGKWSDPDDGSKPPTNASCSEFGGTCLACIGAVVFVAVVFALLIFL